MQRTWQIEPAALFRSYRQDVQEEQPLVAALLVQVTDGGKAEDHYRFHLAGSEDLDVEFGGIDLLPGRDFSRFTFKGHANPNDLAIRQNCATTAWEDLEELVDDGRFDVELAGAEDGTALFKATWAAAKAAQEDFGVGIRWAVLAASDGMKLELQALPGAARQLNRDPRLSNDGCPAVSLGSYALEIEMEERAPLVGPVPVLFAKHPDRSRESIRQNPSKLLKGKENKFA